MNFLRTAVLLTLIALVYSESAPELKSGAGLFPRQDNFGYNNRQPSILRWLSSSFAQMFRPRGPPSNYRPQQQQQYQSNIILPDPPQQDLQEGPEEEGVEHLQDDAEANSVPEYSQQQPELHAQQAPIRNVQYSQQQPPQHQQPRVQGPPPIEVVPSQMIAYNHHQQPHPQAQSLHQQPYPQAQALHQQPYTQPQSLQPVYQQHPTYMQFNRIRGPLPSAPPPAMAPPLGNTIPYTQTVKQYVKNVPIAPHSTTGPDYFSTAYNQGANGQQLVQNLKQQKPVANQFQQLQRPQNNLNAPKGLGAEINYGATFQDIRQQKPFIYNSPIFGGFGAGGVVQPSGQPLPNMNSQFSLGPIDITSQDIGSLISSLDSVGNAYPGADSFVQASQNQQVSVKPPASQQEKPTAATPGYEPSGLPGVQILSQKVDGGNPVFELLADADAPSYDGHPFDINKLIAMIEPGAQIDQLPQMSEAASETKDVYHAAPTSTSSGTDQIISQSAPEPSYFKVDSSSSTNKKTFPISLPNEKNFSSLNEIMKFFKETDGKGYIIVEKKRSRPTTTSDLTHDDEDYDEDDLTDGFTKINITSENLPLLESVKDTENTNVYNLIRDSSTSRFRKPFYSTTFKPHQLTEFPPTVFFAVHATTRHPNHNYNPLNNPSPTPSTDSETISNQSSDESESLESDSPDLETDESQVKSVAITVTPPPHVKVTSSGTTTSTTSTTPLPLPDTYTSTIAPTALPTEFLFVKSNSTANNSKSKSTKKLPAPVYLRKPNKATN